ncbi:MAG: hypothetical protein L7U87_08195 [Chlamydiales bacterium]|nr:hypothetical protein [Chlamydiales bacterium]
MYTKVQFGKDLKNKLCETSDPYEIGKWAFSVYWENVSNLEHNVRAVALTLNTMEDGPEFFFTPEELNQIADDLISSKEPNL